MTLYTAEADLKSLLDLTKENIFAQLNCHALGTIQSFDSVKQTAEVSVNYKRHLGGQLADYPILIDCPVIVLAGGTGSLSFPIAKGDTCLLIFNDRDIDNWFSSGQITGLASPRMHSFTDAIALVGLRSMQNKITDYDATHTQLRQGSTKISLGDKVKIENNATDLKTVLNSLIDAIAAITVTCAAPGSPSTPPVNVAAILAIKTTLAGLLE